jgi:hypothetical protein
MMRLFNGKSEFKDEFKAANRHRCQPNYQYPNRLSTVGKLKAI